MYVHMYCMSGWGRLFLILNVIQLITLNVLCLNIGLIFCIFYMIHFTFIILQLKLLLKYAD